MSENQQTCPSCGVLLRGTAPYCPHCHSSLDGTGEMHIQGTNAQEVMSVAGRLQKQQYERDMVNQDIKLVKTLLLGVFFVSVLFSVLGVALVYLGSTESMDVSIFGQKMSSTGPGVASIFLGAVLVGTTGRQLFNYVRRR